MFRTPFRRHWEGTLNNVRSRFGCGLAPRLLLCLPALAAWAYAALPAAAQAPAALPAEEATPLPAAGDPGDGVAPGPMISTWDFVRMVLLLAAVVAAIYVLFLVLRKVAGGRVEERGLIRVLDSRTLAPGRSLHLVRVADQTWLVGCSERSVSMVPAIPAPGPPVPAPVDAAGAVGAAASRERPPAARDGT